MSPTRRKRAAEDTRQITVRIFAALGDDQRLSMVGRLSSGDQLSISELTQGTVLTRQAVTKHLRVLENAGLVYGERRGREVRFALDAKPVRRASEFLKGVSDQWDEALARLKTLVEEEGDSK